MCQSPFFPASVLLRGGACTCRPCEALLLFNADCPSLETTAARLPASFIIWCTHFGATNSGVVGSRENKGEQQQGRKERSKDKSKAERDERAEQQSRGKPAYAGAGCCCGCCGCSSPSPSGQSHSASLSSPSLQSPNWRCRWKMQHSAGRRWQAVIGMQLLTCAREAGLKLQLPSPRQGYPPPLSIPILLPRPR